MSTMFDAIVVGARCAGAATALLLARRGYRVMLLDRARFPSESPNGHFVLHPGLVKLHQWGLLQPLLDSGCPQVSHWTSTVCGDRLSSRIPERDGVPASLGPRRSILDKLLIDAAVAAGAELREGVSLTDVLQEDGRVVGIRGRTNLGASFSEKAHMVVGADGRRSRLAQLVGAECYLDRPTLNCYYYSYWEHLPVADLEIAWHPGRVLFAFPTHDDLTAITIGWPIAEFEGVRADIDASFHQALKLLSPSLSQRIGSARRIERYIGQADLPNFFRRCAGTGWALVGDAGHHKDPLGAYGISDAFRDAELLADAIDLGLSGRQPLYEALISYQRLRDERAVPDYEWNYQRAQLQGWDRPELMRLRAVLRDNQLERVRFFEVMAKMRPAAEFFAPENLQRLLRAA